MNDRKIVENYRDNEAFRNQFFEFIKIVFGGLDFKRWYEKGFWNDNFVPYSIIKDDKIVSNVSTSQLQILLNGKVKKGIQIGSVGTLPEYREQGLAKELMNYVIRKHEDSADLFFLFANESVLKFYPKFGFQKFYEVIFQHRIKIRPQFAGRKLNIEKESDIAIIKNLLNDRLPVTKIFGASNYQFITFWHLLNIFPENIIYLEEENLIFIVTEEKNELHVWDVIFTQPVDISKLLSKVVRGKGIKSVFYYFSPDQLHFAYDGVVTCEDSPLFIRGEFPVRDKPFKFPTTAQT